jgi:uncharacterized membrane protein YebE (DUF533 family)
MNARSLLDALFQSGQDTARTGRQAAERGLGVPAEGPLRDLALSSLGKGALAGGALSLLLGTRGGRRTTSRVVKLGSLAALGTLAYKAYQSWDSGRPDAGGAAKSLGKPASRDSERHNLALLRAMIAAAKADGHVDETERARIEAQIREMGLESETAQFLRAELAKPLDVKEVAAGADSPEAAAEIYLASLLAIDVDNAMERHYMQKLARELKLDPALVRQLEEQAEEATAD